MIQLATFTTLYPNDVRPHHGVFVEQRLRHLLATNEVRSRVVAPVPWFPFRSSRFGAYARFAEVSSFEVRNGIAVSHPRYPLLPKVGMTIAPLLMAAAVRPHVRRLLQEDPAVDVIDAHYFYPDGVAAAILGKWFRKPVVVTARGTDVNLIPDYRFPRKQILWAARRSASIITVCQALKDRLLELGVRDTPITVLRNGVDLQTFRPGDREETRRRLGLRGPLLLSVGLLIERKGHHIAIEAMPQLPDVHLLIIGDGESEVRKRLLAQVRDLGLGDRVRFLPPMAQSELRDYYVAADALVLASSREGMANVLLESIACGTPVIAAPSWGTPEVVSDPAAGVLMKSRDARSLVCAVKKLFSHYPGQGRTRAFAEKFDWEATTLGQLSIFEMLRRGANDARLIGKRGRDLG